MNEEDKIDEELISKPSPFNSKKRKRSEALTPTSMVLRSKVKRRKVEG